MSRSIPHEIRWERIPGIRQDSSLSHVVGKENDTLGDSSFILSIIIPKTKKMVFGASLLNTQGYKAHIKGKVELSLV